MNRARQVALRLTAPVLALALAGCAISDRSAARSIAKRPYDKAICHIWEQRLNEEEEAPSAASFGDALAEQTDDSISDDEHDADRRAARNARIAVLALRRIDPPAGVGDAHRDLLNAAERMSDALDDIAALADDEADERSGMVELLQHDEEGDEVAPLEAAQQAFTEIDDERDLGC